MDTNLGYDCHTLTLFNFIHDHKIEEVILCYNFCGYMYIYIYMFGMRSSISFSLVHCSYCCLILLLMFVFFAANRTQRTEKLVVFNSFECQYPIPNHIDVHIIICDLVLFFFRPFFCFFIHQTDLLSMILGQHVLKMCVILDNVRSFYSFLEFDTI